ncbi:MAG: ATP-binding protein [Stackebrandtia sp.]
MSLRAKLILIVLGVLAVSLGGAVGGTFGALQDWSDDRNDDVLVATGEQIQESLEAGDGWLYDDWLDEEETPGDAAQTWKFLAEQGEIPSFVAIYHPDGRLAQDVAYGPRPRLSDRLPDELRPADPGDGETLHRDGEGWLLWSSRMDDDRVLVVATRTAISDELVARVRNVAIGCTLAALIAGALACGYAVRRQLRPLEAIAATADVIGAGDLSRRVESADGRSEVGRLSKALNSMLAQLESSFAARAASQRRLRQFVGDASHELRTPIAVIRGYAELFHRGAAARPDDLAKAMRRIESEAQRMGSLVEEMLLLARLDEGRPLRPEPVDLTAVASDAVADAQAVEPDRPLRLEADDAVVVLGDPDRLRQVFANLLSNVLRHTPAGSPAEVRLRRTRDHAVIEVRDTGAGLSAEERERVFDRFYRVDDSRTRDRGGSGLGLSIVAGIAQAHGGDAGVESAPDAGAVFRVRLPLPPAEDHPDGDDAPR